MTTIAIIYHSGFGHTEVVAEHIAKGATAAGGEAVLLKIESATQDFSAILEQATAADAIIFGAPTYMGDVSAPLKSFFEASSKIWFTLGWKDKVAGGFTNSLSFAGDKGQALNSILTLAMQQGMIWVGTGLPPGAHSNSEAAPDVVNRLGFYIGVATQSDNAAPDVTPPPGDREFARLYGARITEITKKLKG